MPLKRIDAGTDVATVGIWDPQYEPDRHLNEAARRERADRAQIFYVSTGADGSYPIDVFLNEEPPRDYLAALEHVGDFRLTCTSGRLRVGGVEDFTREQKQITGPDDVIEVPAGDYTLAFWLNRRTEEETARETERALKSALGEEGYQYWQARLQGCGGLVAGLLAGLATAVIARSVTGTSWASLWGLLPIVLAVAVLRYRQRALARDPRYQELQRIADPIVRRMEEWLPTFAWVLMREPRPDLRGGWYELS